MNITFEDLTDLQVFYLGRALSSHAAWAQAKGNVCRATETGRLLQAMLRAVARVAAPTPAA